MARSLSSGALAAPLVGAVLVLAVLACSAEAPPPTVSPEERLCEAMASTAQKCGEGCEGVLRAECGRLAKALHPEGLTTATDCFLSGACSSVCLSKALSGLAPTQGQVAIRAAYCKTCAKGQADCEPKFFEAPRPSAAGGPGTQLLPFSDAVTGAIAADCAADEGCQLGFPPCSLESVKKGLTEAVGAPAAECLVRGLKAEEGERRAPDGGAIVVTCTAKNCAGCCRDDLCLVGDAKDACGTRGAACETCSGTSTCEASACKAPCGPDNCTGCCENNVCVEGFAKEACGRAGASCQKCGAAFVCAEQTCVDTSCKATCAGCCSGSTCLGGGSATACGKAGNACVDCGKGRTCSGTAQGTCALDPTALFDVTVTSASLPLRSKSGGAWDFYENLPDPYAKAYSSLGTTSHSGTTATISDTTSPQWTVPVLTAVPARELLNSFSVEVWDDDYDFDDFVGGCAIRLDASMFDGAVRSVSCPATPSGSPLTVRFRLVAR